MSRPSLQILLVTCLLALVLSALAWQSTYNRTITLFPNDNYRLITQSDSFSLGGNSTSEVNFKDGKLILNCEIKRSAYQWPFCNITIPLDFPDENGNPVGTDLSRFEFVQLRAKYVGRSDLTFRLQMRNYSDSYSYSDNIESWKFLTTEFPSKESEPLNRVPIQSLQVPNWWLNFNKIPLQFSMPEYDQIMVFELATGNGIAEGSYTIEVEEISVIGKHFKDEELFGWVIIVLISAIVFYLLNSIRHQRIMVNSQREQVINLSKKNKSLQQKNESLSDKVNIDALTGLLNRHACETIFPSLQNGDSLIIMDLDHFKSVNDNHGHDVGDKVLLTFARAINSRMRKTDYFIRWGGEEFVSICPQTSVSEARAIADKYRSELKKTDWPKGLKMTCSFGIAEMCYGETPDMLLKRADSALYQAKNAGRDRVEVSK